VEGAERFLNRIWRLVAENIDELKEKKVKTIDMAVLGKKEKELYQQLNICIKRVTGDLETRMNFNTAISAIMELSNAIYHYLNDTEEADYELLKVVIDKMLLLLSPFAPNMTAELWEQLGNDGSINERAWPGYDEAALVKDEVNIVVQINGKVRDRVEVSADIDENELREVVLAREKVQEYIGEKEIVKFIVIPKKLVNIVIK